MEGGGLIVDPELNAGDGKSELGKYLWTTLILDVY